MKWSWKARPSIGPFRLNLSNGRWTSTTLKIGRFSRNLTHGTTTYDHPGPGAFRFGGGRSRSRRSSSSRGAGERGDSDTRRRVWPWVLLVLAVVLVVGSVLAVTVVIPAVESWWDGMVAWWEQATDGRTR